MLDPSSIATIAALIAGFSAGIFAFRIQRELEMRERGELTWIPWADRILILATTVALLLVLFPLIAFYPTWPALGPLIVSTLAAAVILLASYPFALLAHYRLLGGAGRTSSRKNPEPLERAIVYVAGALALAILIGLYLARAGAA